jgi:hypothetical protein
MLSNTMDMYKTYVCHVNALSEFLEMNQEIIKSLEYNHGNDDYRFNNTFLKILKQLNPKVSDFNQHFNVIYRYLEDIDEHISGFDEIITKFLKLYKNVYLTYMNLNDEFVYKVQDIFQKNGFIVNDDETMYVNDELYYKIVFAHTHKDIEKLFTSSNGVILSSKEFFKDMNNWHYVGLWLFHETAPIPVYMIIEHFYTNIYHYSSYMKPMIFNDKDKNILKNNYKISVESFENLHLIL